MGWRCTQKTHHRALAIYSDKFLTSTKTIAKDQNHKNVKEGEDPTVQSSWMTSVALQCKASTTRNETRRRKEELQIYNKWLQWVGNLPDGGSLSEQ